MSVKKIITSDGSTLLGADDKAGVAEIITTAEYLIQNPEIKHGKIEIFFHPRRGNRERDSLFSL